MLGTEVVYVDPLVARWGLENILVAIGGDLIEVTAVPPTDTQDPDQDSQVVSPVKPGTSAGRLLSKRGDGGYMIIMQTLDAVKQRKSIESRGLAKVIWEHESDDAVCVQYHPKGIKGKSIVKMPLHLKFGRGQIGC